MEKGMATAPVFLPGESHGQRSLAGYSPWGCKELDKTEAILAHRHRKKKEERRAMEEKLDCIDIWSFAGP